jgi:hypothetical protein
MNTHSIDWTGNPKSSTTIRSLLAGTAVWNSAKFASPKAVGLVRFVGDNRHSIETKNNEYKRFLADGSRPYRYRMKMGRKKHSSFHVYFASGCIPYRRSVSAILNRCRYALSPLPIAVVVAILLSARPAIAPVFLLGWVIGDLCIGGTQS